VRISPSRLMIFAALLAAMGRSYGQYVEDSIDVGASWVGSLAYNSHEDVLYGRCQQASTFFAISCDSNKVVNSFPLGRPRQMMYDSIDNKAYCPYEGAGEDSLAVIDGHTHTLVKRIGMPGATTAVWDPVSDRVYVSCQSTNSVAVVDCVTDSLLEYVPVGACPMKMYINTLRRKLYVLNYDDGTISIVDMGTNKVIKTVYTQSANAGWYSRCADKFYCDGPPEQCVVLDGQSDTIVARVSLPGTNGIFSATGNERAGLVYLGTANPSGGNDYVATVSAQNDSVVATTVIGREPWGMEFYNPSGLLYCVSARTDEVRVLTGDGAGVLTTLSVGDCPYVFAAVPRHNRLYLGHLNGRYVYVLRDTSAGIAESHSLGLAFQGVSVTPNPFAQTQSVAVAWPSPAKEGEAARVYAQDGRLVKQARIPAGEARWVWNGRDEQGRLVPPGVYVLAAPGGIRAKAIKLR
jgi:YVTN family beta-propeller protein